MVSTIHRVVVNLDGALVDSIDAHTQAWRLAMSEFGIIPSQDVIRRMIGLNPQDILQSVAGVDWHSPVGQAILRRRTEIYVSRFQRSIRALPESIDAMRSLYKAGIDVAVVTASPVEEAADAIELARCDDYAATVVTGSDAKFPAGLADTVSVALRKTGMELGYTVLIGTTDVDARTAEALGLPLIGLQPRATSEPALVHAMTMFESPADLLAACRAAELARMPEAYGTVQAAFFR
jgi:phosphoglycolate phosphatase-like HAD superfamily hydrolase